MQMFCTLINQSDVEKKLDYDLLHSLTQDLQVH